MEASLNSVTLQGIMLGLFADIADDSRQGIRILPIRRTSVGGEILLQLLVGVLDVMTSSLIPASLNSPLFIV